MARIRGERKEIRWGGSVGIRILSGYGSGVGFRYRATYIAEAVGIAGWVEESLRRPCRDGSAGDGRTDPGNDA